jgi:hypothetical protein
MSCGREDKANLSTPHGALGTLFRLLQKCNT